jgi:hypothetical protein
MSNTISYEQITNVKVSDSRNVVISTCSKGGYTIAQQLEAVEDGKPTLVFLKGAIHIDDVNSLIDLRDAINVAIDAENEKEKW